jgi:hypothetical protein
MNNFNKEASMPLVGRMAVGGVLGGLAGRAYGDSKSDGALSGRLAGTVAGAAGGALAGLGVHGARKLINPAFTNGIFSSGNILTGIIGSAAAAGTGLGAAHLASKSSPRTFDPDYITEAERADNLRIKALAEAYKTAGGNFGRMDVADAQALRNYINDPKFNSRAMTAIRGPEAVRMGSKYASYYQPTEMDLTNAAYHMQLRRALALRQLMAMQQMQQMQQQPSLQYMGSANTPEEAANKLRGIIQNSQQPTEEQARAMINQYMGAAGVDTSSDKAQAAADKYDSKPAKDQPERKSKPTQKPVQIKSKGKQNKTASMSLSDVQTLEKVAGEAYPTYYHQDGSVTKDINGVSHTFSPSGILKTSSALDYLKNPKVVAGALGLGALGYVILVSHSTDSTS